MKNTDEELVRAYVRGDQGAFTQLVNRHREGLVKFITRAGRDHAAAEDIVQRALIKAHRHLAKFDPDKLTFRQWVYMICANCYRDNRRRRKQITNWQFDQEYQTPALDTRLTHEDVRNKFWQFVDTLTPQRKQAVCMIFVEGLSYSEASERSGVLVPTLKKRVRTVRHELTAALGEAPDDLNIVLERRHAPRVARPNPFYSVHCGPDTFTLREWAITLSEDQYQAVQVVCYDGIRVAEASDMLGLPERTIDLRLDGAIDGLERRINGKQRISKVA